MVLPSFSQMKAFFLAALVATVCVGSWAHSEQWQMQPLQIHTRWAASVDPAHALPEYPRPQLVRENWQNLNGLWNYAVTGKDGRVPQTFDGKILVPYPIESALSGVKKALLPDQLLWYQRAFMVKSPAAGERTLLHFGAVDYQATVFLNDRQVGEHAGGYQNFDLDITDALKPGTNTLLVKVYDPTDSGPNPHGKQTLKPEGVEYTATSGIWQTVWLERVPATYIQGLKLSPDVNSSRLRVDVDVSGDRAGLEIEAVARVGKAIIATQRLSHGQTIELPIKNPRLWSPDGPFLYDLQLRLLRGTTTVDQVQSYFGMRKIELKKDDTGVPRIYLNDRFTYNLGVLDQGFWPESLYTAPTDAALRSDIETFKEMGFNTIRKHIKVEPERWYYYCDKVGMLVWQDMVPPADDSWGARSEFETEAKENIAQLYNHPSITTWVIFNEGWGAFDQNRIDSWIKQLDASRLVSGDSGSSLITTIDSPSTVIVGFAGTDSDINDFHTYPNPYLSVANPEKAQVIGEYGGVGVPVEEHDWKPSEGWGYITVSQQDLAKKYQDMAKKLKDMEAQGLSGSIYTQPYDVETELNGLMTYDREVIKIPLTELNQVNKTLTATDSRLARGR